MRTCPFNADFSGSQFRDSYRGDADAPENHYTPLHRHRGAALTRQLEGLPQNA